MPGTYPELSSAQHLGHETPLRAALTADRRGDELGADIRLCESLLVHAAWTNAERSRQEPPSPFSQGGSVAGQARGHPPLRLDRSHREYTSTCTGVAVYTEGRVAAAGVVVVSTKGRAAAAGMVATFSEGRPP